MGFLSRLLFLAFPFGLDKVRFLNWVTLLPVLPSLAEIRPVACTIQLHTSRPLLSKPNSIERGASVVAVSVLP